jgi:hypothetical protein
LKRESEGNAELEVQQCSEECKLQRDEEFPYRSVEKKKKEKEKKKRRRGENVGRGGEMWAFGLQELKWSKAVCFSSVQVQVLDHLFQFTESLQKTKPQLSLSHSPSVSLFHTQPNPKRNRNDKKLSKTF